MTRRIPRPSYLRVIRESDQPPPPPPPPPPEQPRWAGFYEITKTTKMLLRKRPSLWNRFWVRTLIGWEWYDSYPRM